MRLSKLVADGLRWPPFIFSVLTLYWSMSLLCVTYHMQWLNLTRKRNDVLGWAKGMKRIHRFKVLKVGAQDLCREKCMYLCNHRSWADFMVDQYATEGRSLFLSRWAVMAAFPLFMASNYAIRTVLMFKRGSIADKERFNSKIDKGLETSPQSALAIYPEGHRSTDGASLPLKRGMLHYAYSRTLPVQVVIGGNKEAILSEKHQTARFCQTVAVGFSDVVRAEAYPDFEQYMTKVQTTWDEQWDAVFAANWEGLPELREAEPQFDYSADIKIIMVILSIGHIAIGALAARAAFAFWRWAFGLLGALELPVLMAVGLYIAASFYIYSEPVDALTLHQKMLKQRKQPPVLAATPTGAHLDKKLS